MRARITIGIDGGGSGCRVAIRLPGGGVLRVDGGPANAFTDAGRAGVEISETLGRALDQAGLTRAVLPRARICAGVAGCRLPPLAAELAARLPFPARIVDDSETTLHGAFAGGDGTLASLGTGSFFIRKAGGHLTHLGGWGFALGDEGSGAWLGRRAVALSLKAVEGRIAADALSDALMARLAPHPLITLRDAAPVDYAALAPVVLDHAGSALGQCLIGEAVAEVTRALDDLGHAPGAPLVLTGGFGKALAMHLPEGLRAGLVPAKGSALDGALAMAAALP
ncbi:BadF/BadG/BcrA/BcrD ATPase family protein [Rhodophyticola porphyridii]|uniref:BadF/BadG/BcrA/BcrD ATPase family protein n=1 Tax=Rhodophyticola porphyridii TaxID=1852017 RepID=UPI0035CF1847